MAEITLILGSVGLFVAGFVAWYTLVAPPGVRRFRAGSGHGGPSRACRAPRRRTHHDAVATFRRRSADTIRPRHFSRRPPGHSRFLRDVYPAPLTFFACPCGGASVWRRSSLPPCSAASWRMARCPVRDLRRRGAAPGRDTAVGAPELPRRHLREGQPGSGHAVLRAWRWWPRWRGSWPSRPPRPASAAGADAAAALPAGSPRSLVPPASVLLARTTRRGSRGVFRPDYGLDARRRGSASSNPRTADPGLRLEPFERPRCAATVGSPRIRSKENNTHVEIPNGAVALGAAAH